MKVFYTKYTECLNFFEYLLYVFLELILIIFINREYINLSVIFNIAYIYMEVEILKKVQWVICGN
jgi:hypothetical protein